MAKEKTNNQLNNELREKYRNILKDFFTKEGEEVLVTNTNEIAIPTLDSSRREKYVVIKVMVPNGSRDGEPYDAYSVAEAFGIHTEEQAAKKRIAEEKKAKKIAADEKRRAEQARLKAEREAKGN